MRRCNRTSFFFHFLRLSLLSSVLCTVRELTDCTLQSAIRPGINMSVTERLAPIVLSVGCRGAHAQQPVSQSSALLRRQRAGQHRDRDRLWQ